ncbi:MAG TPA: TadE family protein [Pyrinomonadaceae bacterium]|nr:TadE family protein [Pyrinomonadaceae bacterium]
MTNRVFKKSERGAAVAEFAVACLFFFTMLIGIIEFGRLLYTHNALTDAARRGARYASLHSENPACVRNIVIYGEKHVNDKCQPTGPPLVNGLNDPSVTIEVAYAGADLDNDPEDETPLDTDFGTNLGTATVAIQNFTFNLGIPLLNINITMPNYRTTMSAESAGQEPEVL